MTAGQITTEKPEVVEERKKRPFRFPKIKKRWIILLVILLVIGALGLRMLRPGRQSAAEIAYTEETVAVRTITNSLSGSGTLLPANAYTVTTLIEGEVLECSFEEGDMVEKDTVLYRVDRSDAATNIEKSQISLEQAQRSYDKTIDTQYARAGISGQVYSLDVAVGDEVKQGETIAVIRDSAVLKLKVPFPADDAAGFYVGQSAEVTLDGSFESLPGTITAVSGSDIVGAGNMLTRNVTIAVDNPGALSDTQVASASVGGVYGADSATFEYRAESTVTAEASGTVAALNVTEGEWVSKDQVLVTLGGDDLADQLQSAADSLRNAQLSMENTQEQLENYTITSPVSGTIVDKQYKTGDTVEGGKTLCTIYDLSYLEMTLNIDELDISSMAVGQSVFLTADAVEGKSFEGVVTKVSVVGSTSGGITSYPVTIRIDETEGLRPGMNVDAEIVIERAENVLAIPNGAISRGNLVLVTETSPSAVKAAEQEAPEGYVYVAVETGVSDDDYIQILSGLQEGDTVAYIPQAAASSEFMMMGMGPMGGMAAMPGGGGGMPSGGGMPGGGMGGGGPRG